MLRTSQNRKLMEIYYRAKMICDRKHKSVDFIKKAYTLFLSKQYMHGLTSGERPENKQCFKK